MFSQRGAAYGEKKKENSGSPRYLRERERFSSDRKGRGLIFIPGKSRKNNWRGKPPECLLPPDREKEKGMVP